MADCSLDIHPYTYTPPSASHVKVNLLFCWFVRVVHQPKTKSPVQYKQNTYNEGPLLYPIPFLWITVNVTVAYLAMCSVLQEIAIVQFLTKQNSREGTVTQKLRKFPVLCRFIKVITVTLRLKSYSSFQCFSVTLINTEWCVWPKPFKVEIDSKGAIEQHCKTCLEQILTFCWPCISVYLSQYLTNLMHKICFTISFISCLYMFRAHVLERLL